MNIPFYQNEWFGIDLIDIAKRVNQPLDQVAGSAVYKEVYQQLASNNWSAVSQNWTDKKHNLSRLLKDLIVANGLREKQILSIGCGMGVVEQTLIDKGFNIHLQECQEISCDYLATKFPDTLARTQWILSQDLHEIPGSTYEGAMAITSTYCLNDLTLELFLKQVYRILKTQGVFVWYETTLTLNDIAQYCGRKLAIPSQEDILWGWKRNMRQLKQKSSWGFSPLKDFYLDANNQIMHAGTFPIISSAHWQVVVLKKND